MYLHCGKISNSFALAAEIGIHCVEVKLVLMAQTSPISEMKHLIY